MKNAKVSQHPVFFGRGKPEYPLDCNLSRRDDWDYIDIDFTEMNRTQKDRFLYYSGTIESFSEELIGDLEPQDEIKIPLRDGADEINQYTTIWMGQVGVSAQTHFDRSLNFHTMLYGRKEFILISPEFHEEMKVYPISHIHYQQTQLNFESVLTERNNFVPSNFQANQKIFKSILEPGDMLFLPPYWFHHVSCIPPSPESPSYNFCISTATLSPSPEEFYCSQIQSFNPFQQQADWSIKKKTLVISRFLELLLERLHIPPKIFVDQILLRSRYGSLFQEIIEGSLLNEEFRDHQCWEDIKKDASNQPNLKESLKSFDESMKDHLDNILQMTNKIKKNPLGTSILEICTANLIENLAGFATGPQNSLLFYYYCFT
uniref:JmjC domain-containing protein n=1 Tax=Arcella intermedia TaxID=1963864 RepID=A0A6B2L6F8_9EUKA